MGSINIVHKCIFYMFLSAYNFHCYLVNVNIVIDFHYCRGLPCKQIIYYNFYT